MATIYALRHEKSGAAYIGCTSGKLGKRMREHRCLLRAGKHSARRLQALWDADGSSAFRLVSIEFLGLDADTIRKRERELFWLHHYSALGLLLNEHMVSYRPTDEAIQMGIEASRGAVGNRWSPEANLKRRLAQLGKPKGHGAKISATKRARAMR